MRGAGYTFTAHDARAFTDDEVAQSAVLAAAADAETYPEDPPLPASDLIAGHRAVPVRVRSWEFRAWAPDGALAGGATCEIDPEHDDNPDLLRVIVFVDPRHRRHGVGTAFLDGLIELAHAQGRTRITSWTSSRPPDGARFAEARGARAVTHGHINHLPVPAIDRAELERWAREGRARAPGYELMMWDGPIPDKHLAAFADLYGVMNDAPLDDLDTNDTMFSARQLREWESFVAARGSQVWTLVARAPDGTLAGFHNVNWKPCRPAIVNVEDTGVRPEHRGRALGKWLKAAMTLRILDERPTVTDIRTGNTDSNAAMMGINTAMGYRPLMATTTWELAVEPRA